MRKNTIALASALVAVCVTGSASIQVPPGPDTRTYVWYGELVSLDAATRTMTVKAPVRSVHTLRPLKPADKIVVTWDVVATVETYTVLYVTRYDVMKSSKVDIGYILPAEFVSADVAAKTLTFKTPASESTLQALKSAHPGQWIKVTTPMNQPGETAMLASAEGLSAGPPMLAARPKPADERAKVTTPEEYEKAMKAIGAAFGAINKAIQSGAMADAKRQLTAARSTMMGVQAFWVASKKDDPAMIAKDSLEKMAALDKALALKIVAVTNIDEAAVVAAFKAVGGTCGACHAKYREQDPTTKAFRIKAGTL